MKKEKGPKFEHEDWCNYCRDGGDVVMCYHCPRGIVPRRVIMSILLIGLDTVFHAECHGVSKAEVARKSMMVCRQHSCIMCSRSTGDAGGMLFRCQTCPQAFCEDCLPQDDIDAIGETLPELFVTSILTLFPSSFGLTSS